ncbi:putative nicotinate-nucleotide pyrophosphorylase [carboxylating] [Candidatus Kuenenia stuttgartiensis]|uniref:Probable nicotinate-nucleotide pyrophosphorylase [carboxylating] n=1 Tax=Kuenenia stuttgartiensis TaxID=174633 RepID=Q1PY31_KUEST|nr:MULTISPECIES: carboxylating nicotinate-nucleotide diphosphorylase [Bacteria]MBE7546335.1 carboxylating nicotinate-nucleotide diphosphorylase [Planctomycetia bacterium]MBW7941297.1 carboxylating nicotinate-nucleotide diphosphorylase [Candidatus Kuenenia stuttgartiensis]MBZ0192051.1 carboxylating nicotinate-nucleotide diphosphorylase [Candidatus Kuenenia stuttgartiensis]MCF6151176.1 carboxylating nicotinate-nucleotide diphosphorylase [Candidatus Kuenenia stuttgartiensis]MCL4725779.1 carboxyla
MNFVPEKIDILIQLAIREDIGSGDITTESIFPPDLTGEGEFLAKEDGVIAGLPVVERLFSKIDKNILLKKGISEGMFVKKGDVIASVNGNVRPILSGERIALNFLQRLSGIATLTAQFVEEVKPLKVAVMDTRKTAPGWRYLEKYAVAIGGGVNHRMGLYDQVLVKDNHLDFMKKELLAEEIAGISVIEKTVSMLRRKIGNHVLIEMETRTLSEVEDAIKADVDVILLDNMDAEKIRSAVSLVKNGKYCKGAHRPLTEASGNITLDNVKSIAQTGVDRISIGALTHSAKALDISLKISLQ